MKRAIQTTASMLAGLLFFGLALFVPAWSFHYWQAWVFIAVFMLAVSADPLRVVSSPHRANVFAIRTAR